MQPHVYDCDGRLIEIEITDLEYAHAERSDVVYHEGKGVEALHARISGLIERLETAPDRAAPDSPRDQQSPHN